MGWNISLEVNTGNGYVEIGESRNYTYNISPMYYKAFELKEGFRGLNGMTTIESIKYLSHAINEMKVNKEEYEKLNPENGWGDYQGALEILEWLRVRCLEHPFARISIT